MQEKTSFYSQRIIWFLVIGVLAALIIVFFIWQPYSTKPKPNAHDPAFAGYVVRHTSGVISKNGTIRIELAPEIGTSQILGKEDSRNLFSFYPAASGKTVWIDANIIEFQPTEPLKSGQSYVVSFALGRLTNVPQNLREFNFDFRVVEPSFELEISGLKSQSSSSLEYMSLEGSLHFSDTENPESIEKILRAVYASTDAAIRWEHQPGLHTSTFHIDSIRRQQQAVPFELTYDGAAIGAKKSGKQTFDLPALGSFKVLSINAMHEPEQHILVQFSDPILVAQHLEGMIEVEGVHHTRFSIDGSEVRIYPPDRLESTYVVRVHPGIENISQRKLSEAYTASLMFENRLPAVSIPGRGIILPGTGKLTMPFEAVNLRAVDVSIIRIYENNVPQYFQRNYDDPSELRRVGKPVVQTTIALDADKGLNLRKKNRFSLDIDKLIKTEPGAIYRVLIGFRQQYSVYPCGTASPAESNSESELEDPAWYGYGASIDEDDDFWARYNNYYPRDYEWEERDNPCHPSYFTAQRWASRDMLASNIGLISKRGNDGSLTVFASDLISALPMSGVEIKLLDYQQQLIESGTTDAQGSVRFKELKKPFLLLASKEDERGYLKLDDGSSLPLGRFDVGGDLVQEGLKGFIYTERGVWRPGDSLFVGFILQETTAGLPDGHPVTFELLDAQGRLFHRLVETESKNGFYVFRTATDKTSPTGNWLARVRVGGATFQRSLKIETIQPNRLKVDLDFKKQKILGITDEPFTLHGTWLFGAVAKNLRARVETSLLRDQTRFSNYPGYTFDDPTREFVTENQVLFDGPLDEQGKAIVPAPTVSSNRAPGMVRATMITRIFEPGGNFSIDYTQMPFSPYPRYVGVQLPQGDPLSGMLLTDQEHQVSIVMVDPQGKPASGRRQVQVEFYKIRWNWWWNQDAEYLGNFTQDRYNQLLKKETIDLEEGRGSWTLKVSYPDWGRYLVRVVDPVDGHASGKTLYIDWPGWAKREQLNNPTEASMLSFTADKDQYKVNETIHLTIPTATGGRGLISIENGSRVLKSEWIDTQAGQTRYSFKAEAGMAPNIFVNVTLLQPHAQTANDLPIRMYGVIPLLVEDPTTHLEPVIDLPTVLRPESNVRIQVRENQGKPMTYTIALVDEGLLDLTRFPTPDPHRVFYARESLGVKTWDLFDQVLGAWGGDLERILSIGGDAETDRNIPPAKANRFEPMVQFLGPFTLKKGAQNTHEISLPAYVGSVRAMVVAAHEGAYGSAEKTAQVKKPLMLLATAPRVIGPEEQFRVPLTVFSMEKGARDVQVSFTSNSPLMNVSGTTQTLHFTGEGEQVVYVDVKTASGSGVGKLTASARSGSQEARYEVELEVRNPNPYVTRVENFTVAAGQTWEKTLAQAAAREDETLRVEISTLPPINLQASLNRLIRNPHGGLEQIVSSIFPQLFLHHLMELTEQQKQQIQGNVQAGIHRIRGYALIDGGFGYWPEARQSHEWISNFAGHFLLEAQAQGYTIPVGLLEQWTRFQQDRARKWTPSQYNWRGGDLIQAYRLYGLALAGSPEIGAMNRLKEFSYLSDEAAWRLASAYQMIGQQVVAGQIVRGRSLTPAAYTHPGFTYGSVLRDQAMMLETLSLMKRAPEADRLISEVAHGIARNQRYNVQATAYGLVAIARYMDSFSKSTHFALELDGKRIDVDQETYLYQLEIPGSRGNDGAGGHALKVHNKSEGNLHVRILRDGQLPPGQHPDVPTSNDLLDLRVRYTNLSGETLDPQQLPQGTDFIAEVTIKNTGRLGTYDQLALTQIFPAGWELINARMAAGAGLTETSAATHTEIRDDRVLRYFSIRQNEALTFRTRLNAAYIGRYFLPSVVAESLTDDRIQDMVRGGWVAVQDLENE